MKRAVLVGAVAFLLGAASAPKAANENETLTLLCKRYEATAMLVEQAHARMLAKRGARSERDEAVAVSLSAVRDMLCRR